jgi:hypothetical protein
MFDRNILQILSKMAVLGAKITHTKIALAAKVEKNGNDFLFFCPQGIKYK